MFKYFPICTDRVNYKHSINITECLYPTISAENTAVLPNRPPTTVVYPILDYIADLD